MAENHKLTLEQTVQTLDQLSEILKQLPTLIEYTAKFHKIQQAFYKYKQCRHPTTKDKLESELMTVLHEVFDWKEES